MATETVQTDAPQVEDRRDVLREQFDAIEKTDSPDVKQSAERVRDEQGKFATKDAAQIKAKDTEIVPAVAAQPTEEPLWKRPPASWKKDYHEVWKGADPRLQEYAFQREEQMRAGVEPLLPKAQLADQITRVAEPYMNTIRGMNIDLPTAVEGLMKADHQLRTLPMEQKVQYLAGLARSYGIDLNAAAGAQQGQSTVNPDFYALQNELNNVRGEVLSFKQQQEKEKEQAVLSEINKFAQTAEHFEEVRPTMVQLLQSGVAETIEDAYKKAIRLNDELSGQISAAKQAETDAAKRDTANRAAKAAKAAAVSVKSSTPGNQATTKAQDRRSVLREQFDSMSERL